MFDVILSFLTSFILTYFAIPSIINIAQNKRIYDVPISRSSHKEKKPSLGGIGMFSGIIFSVVYWTPFDGVINLQYIICALLILFLVGARDDLLPVTASKKMIGQVMAAAILVFKTDIQLNSFYGLMGLYGPLPTAVSVILSIITILVIINAINLIDGIDGLAGCLSAIIVGCFGVWFYVNDLMSMAIIAFASLGAIFAFLRYNILSARIFMGDTGSMLLGMINAILVIKFIDINHHLPSGNPFKFESGVAIAIGILMIPLYDTIRVFLTRVIRGQSPFKADRRHIHHLLIDTGISHTLATTILAMFSVFMITLVMAVHSFLELHLLLLLELLLMSTFTYYFHYKRKLQNTD